MATFYDESTALEATTKSTPEIKGDIGAIQLSAKYQEQKTEPLKFFVHSDGITKVKSQQSIMNEHAGINYRTIWNNYNEARSDDKHDFTAYDDYKRCINADKFYKTFIMCKKNPTYKNILYCYSNSNFDKHGLSSYKMADFVYLKYFNQIPNNHMITLRRYAQPVPDHVFGLDMNPETSNALNKFHSEFFALATAVTYLGEKAGNKLSDILKFDYGAKWETKTANVNQLQSTDGGLAAQLGSWGISSDTLSGTGSFTDFGGAFGLAVASKVSGRTVAQIQASQHAYPQNAFLATYGEEFYGDINSITETSMRARGLTFSNNFSLVFEYSLKSLKCVNPKIAMMDILSNFLMLTGNYGTFWGGETIYYGVRNIGPQFGNPQLLREGKYGQYLNSLANDVRRGFERFQSASKDDSGNFSIFAAISDLMKGGLQALLGNLLGGKVGHAGEAQAPPALLSGEPTGFWHLTIGNPLDPIAMMGNMKIEKTTVQFNDVLGYDDFPTEIKFTVDISHAKPRDNSGIESMFNGAKGRFYVLSKNIKDKFDINYKGGVAGMKGGTGSPTQEASDYAQHNSSAGSGLFTTGKLKIIGSMLG